MYLSAEYNTSVRKRFDEHLGTHPSCGMFSMRLAARRTGRAKAQHASVLTGAEDCMTGAHLDGACRVRRVGMYVFDLILSLPACLSPSSLSANNAALTQTQSYPPLPTPVLPTMLPPHPRPIGMSLPLMNHGHANPADGADGCGPAAPRK